MTTRPPEAYTHAQHKKLRDDQRLGTALALKRLPVPPDMATEILGTALPENNKVLYNPKIIGDNFFVVATLTPGLHIEQSKYGMALTTTIDVFAIETLHYLFKEDAKRVILDIHGWTFDNRYQRFTKTHTTRPVAEADITSAWRNVRALCKEAIEQIVPPYVDVTPGVSVNVRETIYGEFILQIPKGAMLVKNGPYASGIHIVPQRRKRDQPNTVTSNRRALKKPRTSY